MTRSTIVVPCFDEAARFQPDRFLAFRRTHPEISFVLVNDGSRDSTLARLSELAGSDPEGLQVLDLQPNRGKAEAVRAGLLRAFEGEPDFVGYWDADLSAPLDEIPRFVSVLEREAALTMVFGARVQLMGRSIQRSSLRHYVGRVFATVVSTLLGLPIYDTQCGAKLFRNCDETRALFAEPFVTNWTFDVEILARLIQARGGPGNNDAAQAIYELPLDRWHEVKGSKVRPTDFARGLVETLRIYTRYLRS